MDNDSQKLKPISFIIPSEGNRITANDIKHKQIRITAAFKPLFPETDSELKITIRNKYRLVFKYRDKRSHILKLGSDALNELNLEAGGKVVITRIGATEFKLEDIK